jgi:hypothetical protein
VRATGGVGNDALQWSYELFVRGQVLAYVMVACNDSFGGAKYSFWILEHYDFDITCVASNHPTRTSAHH